MKLRKKKCKSVTLACILTAKEQYCPWVCGPLLRVLRMLWTRSWVHAVRNFNKLRHGNNDWIIPMSSLLFWNRTFRFLRLNFALFHAFFFQIWMALFLVIGVEWPFSELFAVITFYWPSELSSVLRLLTRWSGSDDFLKWRKLIML